MGINKYRDMETDQLKANVGKIGTAGLSERQKSQQRAQAMQAAGQQAQVQQTGLNRQMMAQGGQMQGGYAQQANQLANAGAQAGAQAGFQAEQMSQQIAAARDTQIRADMARQSDITRQNWQKAIDTGMQINEQGVRSAEAAAKLTTGS
tara:strand:+ start:1145 stop:1591 length:447 start_codon:yes stop_codon:yes gene_type:complete